MRELCQQRRRNTSSALCVLATGSVRCLRAFRTIRIVSKDASSACYYRLTFNIVNVLSYLAIGPRHLIPVQIYPSHRSNPHQLGRKSSGVRSHAHGATNGRGVRFQLESPALRAQVLVWRAFTLRRLHPRSLLPPPPPLGKESRLREHVGSIRPAGSDAPCLDGGLGAGEHEESLQCARRPTNGFGVHI